MLALGTPAPAFALPDVRTGTTRDLTSFATDSALLVVFLCAHCPYVLHVAPELARITQDYANKPLQIVGITSNDVEQYPQDAPEPTAQFANTYHLYFPILYDASQTIAKAYSAACTPDFFLFNAARRLVYRGQIDSSRPRRGPDRPGVGELTGAELRAAIDSTLAGNAVPEPHRPSIGCSIKWLPGNEPQYFAQ